jgi:hypothetical protein
MVLFETCEDCGALVSDPAKHALWHENCYADVRVLYKWIDEHAPRLVGGEWVTP